MKSISERALEYTRPLRMCGELSRADDIFNGYTVGATEERALLMKWNDPDNPPNKAENILIKYKREKEEDSIELYEVGYWNGKAYFSTYDYDYLPNIIGWREIHE